MKILSLPLMVLLLFAQLTETQAQDSRPAPADTMPFRRSQYNNMIIQKVLNEGDTPDLMFHAAADAVSLSKDATATINSLKFAPPA